MPHNNQKWLNGKIEHITLEQMKARWKTREWYQDESIGGYYDENGRLIVVEEYGSDADFDRHAVDVANGNGYYDDDGRYVSYGASD